MTCGHSKMTQVHSVIKYLTVYMIQPEGQDENALKRNYTTHTNACEHWNYLVEHGDSKQIWQAIGWNGSFDTPPDKVLKPTDLL